ncbi:MAG TPA: TonB-dependent receptor [Thermoanaerobaculia bacterium]|nr:TonB-dependent receptor [Thermoanaerobaculia bacterium]
MRTSKAVQLSVAAALATATLWAQAPPAPAEGAQAPEEEQAQSTVEEVIVVTASRTQQTLNESPAAISVLDQQTIQSIPADDYGDLLRNIPGFNVIQTSARDINITARGSTNTLATSQLVLVDGRSLYLDFFGFVMWDFLPVNPLEIKQIEAVRGPGSAVWGANAMTGVVNVITKRPKEIVGTSVLLGGGELGTKYGSITHAGISGDFGYKLSGGYYEQDAYERPPLIDTFENAGTKQPKGEVRLDWDVSDDSYFSFGAGLARTDGIIHTGIGPFDIDSGTELSYAKLDWNKQAWHVGGFWNRLDADSQNLLSQGVDGGPLPFAFQSDTYNLEVSNTSIAGMSNILTYGGNFRTSDFELEIAPLGTSKDEWGAFLQDEILLGDKVRWLIGGRYDDIDPIDGVFTPRTSLLFSPVPNQSFRVSYNEAFRSPSVINSYLDATILIDLAPLPFLVPATAIGNVVLDEEHVTAYEVGWVGSFSNRVIATVSAYENTTEDSIDFYTSATYGPGNLPPPFNPATGVGIPPALIPCFLFAPGTFPPCALVGGGLAGLAPSDFSYRNIGETTDRGVELSIQQRVGEDWSWFFNASWQDDPEFKGIPDAATSQNLPPEWRGNLGFSFDNGSYFWGANANYQDEAYWADVPFATGTTDSFTMVNISLGMRLMSEQISLSILGNNVFDEDVQQHIFGDIISRKITGQVGFRF